MNKSIHLIHSDEYQNWIFDETHPTQGRRFTNARDLLIGESEIHSIEIIETLPRLATVAELHRVHSDQYLNEILKQNLSTEWDGPRPDLAHLAQLFVGGTLTALELLLTSKAQVAVNFPGAKHHAKREHSSGFCIFNDLAIAADIASKDHGLNVLIIDIDGHHGDGTEELMAGNSKVITCSIHHYGIFPGTGKESKANDYYNFPLEYGDGDNELVAGLEFFIDSAAQEKKDRGWEPDLLFIACGADGHAEDLLTGLQYSVAGYVKAAELLKATFGNLPILVGGAGGYLPDGRTPEIWSKFVTALI